MEEFTVWCANIDCDLSYVYKCQSEDISEDSEHSAVCPECGKTTLFEMIYEIVLTNERLATPQ